MKHQALAAAVARPLVAFLAATAGIAACGGGGGGDGPTPPASSVTSVEVTAPSPTLEVGSIMIVSVKYFDASHRQLSGKTATWASSNATIASVNGPTVTGVSVGSVQISATVDGKTGSVSINIIPVPVSSVTFTPVNPVVRQGETLQIVGQPIDAVGRPLAGRPVAYSTANANIATVNQTSGIVTGVSPGSVYIRGESEGKKDSVLLRVKSLNAPAISGTSQAQLVPGATGTLTGTNFGAVPNDNEVYVNGVLATVTAASPTSVSFTVPAATVLPCTATGPAQIMLVANADTATTTMSLRMATPRSLGVGQSLLLTTDADLRCNEFAATGGKYLFTAFNYAAHAGIRTSFRLLGASAATAAVAASAPAARASASIAPVVQGSPTPVDARWERHLRAHLTQQRQERALARRLGSPNIPQRMRANRPALNRAAPNLAAAVNPPPAVGSTAIYRMQKTFGNHSTYDDVTFRAVYVGSKIIMYEDVAAPLAQTMDPEYERMGQEFDNVMYPLLLSFGNPLVVDSALDNNGHVIALFSPRVNNYTVQGISNAILGFVTLCDYFLRSDCPASNEAEAFYAIAPNPTGTTGQISIENWRRYIRGTLIHEAKHIISYAERYYRDSNVDDLEEIWLEEATAQQASELWARTIYSRQQFGNVTWNDGPKCDYALPGATCPDPAEGILHHFSFLYEHYIHQETKSVLDDDTPGATIDVVIYGSTWSFARWITDQQPDEATFLRALVQQKVDHGIPNLVARTGKPFSELLGLWSLASLADDYPGTTINDPRLQLRSWNTRDLFAQMSANLVFSNGSPAFPRAWPMNVRVVSFGNFSTTDMDVSQLRGGGFAAWELSGTQTAPQVLAVRAPDGGPPPPLLGMAIVRIQ